MEARRLLHRAPRCGASPPAPGARLLGAPPPSPPPQWRCLLQMSDSPAGSNPRTPESSGSGSGGGGKRPAVPAAVSLLPPADPLRQANRLPIRVLKMLSAHTGHLLHPEYLQPLSSTPVSPIEVSHSVAPRPAPSPFLPPLRGPTALLPALRGSVRHFALATLADWVMRDGEPGDRNLPSFRQASPWKGPLPRSRMVFSLIGFALGVTTGSLTFPRHPVSTPERIFPGLFPPPPPPPGFVLFEVRIARVLLRLCPIRLERMTPRHSRSQVFLPPTSLGALPGREGLLRERQRQPGL